MKTLNEMKLSFPSKSQNEAFARAAVSAFIAPLDPTVGELSDLKTAVSEAVTNCVVHGYRRQGGEITINGKITEDRRVILKIRDKGVGIEDIKQAMEPLFTTAPSDKNALARRHLGLVHACCKRFSGKGIEYEELYAAGCLGLTKAINNFDGSRGLQFSTYAFPVIMGEIKRLFRDGGAVRVSRSLRELSLKISRLNNENELKNGEELTVFQLSKALNVSPEEIAEAINSARPALSLTADCDEEGNPQTDVPTPDIQDEISERLSLEAAIDALPQSDREIIRLRYYGCKTQVQTARILNMTQVQVSRREKKILSFIREKMVI